MAISNRINFIDSSDIDTDRVISKILRASHYTNLLGSDGVRRRRIAYAITITKDGNFQDGAAVLAYSIYEASIKGDDLISFIAFVHPNVTTSRPTLKKLGFHVIEGDSITNKSTIRLD